MTPATLLSVCLWLAHGAHLCGVTTGPSAAYFPRPIAGIEAWQPALYVGEDEESSVVVRCDALPNGTVCAFERR